MFSPVVMAKGHAQLALSLPSPLVAFSIAHVSTAGLRACP